MDNSRQLISDTISLMRFPLIVLVVSIHVPQIYGNGTLWQTGCLYLNNGVARCAVPLFFAISGYLFFRKKEPMTGRFYRQQLHKRLLSLVIPYILWNIPGILLCIKNCSGVNMLVSMCRNMGLWPLTGFNSFEPVTPFDGPMWYVRDLFIMAILSPLVYNAVRRKDVGIAVITVLAVCFCMQWIPQFCGISATSLLFFTAGALIAFHTDYFATYINRRKALTSALILSLLWGVTLTLDIRGSVLPYFSTPWHGLQILLGSVVITLAAGLLCLEGKGKVSYTFAPSIFFIYCAHYYVDLFLIAPFRNRFEPTGIYFVAYYAGAIIIAIALCHFIAMATRRYFPRLFSIFTGNRI